MDLVKTIIFVICLLIIFYGIFKKNRIFFNYGYLIIGLMIVFDQIIIYGRSQMAENLALICLWIIGCMSFLVWAEGAMWPWDVYHSHTAVQAFTVHLVIFSCQRTHFFGNCLPISLPTGRVDSRNPVCISVLNGKYRNTCIVHFP